MTENKLCGNCAGDHKYDDCPFIHFRVRKVEWQQILANRKLRELIEERIRIIEEEKDDFTENSQSWNDAVKAHLKQLLEATKV